jgi:asparagine synthase (glutamine-hydrolysing)
MYAFALWDSLERELWLVRDPYGIKPLYVAKAGDTIWFASQARALATCAPVNIARSAPGLAGFYLWGYVPEPFSWWEGIRPLAAGYVLRLRENEALGEAKAFSTVEGLYSSVEPRQFRIDELRQALLESVRYHLVADVPIAIFLSAGVDSNAVAALGAELGQPLTSVTLAFNEYAGTEQDEAPLAKSMAERINARHITVTIDQEEFESLIDDFLGCMDQPSIDAFNMYLISGAAAAQGFKVALCGLGGDELFGGYPSFRQIPKLRKFASILAPLREVARHSPVGFSAVNKLLKLSPKWGGLLTHSSSLARLYLLRRALHVEDEFEMLLDKYWLDHGLAILLRSDKVLSLAGKLEKIGLSEHAQIAALESCTYMRNQLLRDADWAGMARGLEIRLPLVDSHLLERLAPWIASTHPLTKRDLAASAKLSVDMLLNRPRTGFTTPVGCWATARSGNLARGLRGWASEVHRYFRLLGSDNDVLLRNAA